MRYPRYDSNVRSKKHPPLKASDDKNGLVAHPDKYRENRAERFEIAKISSSFDKSKDNGLVAQLNRASDYGSEGFRFDS